MGDFPNPADGAREQLDAFVTYGPLLYCAYRSHVEVTLGPVAHNQRCLPTFLCRATRHTEVLLVITPRSVCRVGISRTTGRRPNPRRSALFNFRMIAGVLEGALGQLLVLARISSEGVLNIILSGLNNIYYYTYHGCG